MSSTLSLFPSRIKIANADGTMTPEFYRALQTLFNRVGGTLGDVGVDTFGIFGQSSLGDNSTSSYFTDVMQSIDGGC